MAEELVTGGARGALNRDGRLLSTYFHVVHEDMETNCDVVWPDDPARSTDVIDLNTAEEKPVSHRAQPTAATTQKENTPRIETVGFAKCLRKNIPADRNCAICGAEPLKTCVSCYIDVVVAGSLSTDALLELAELGEFSLAVRHVEEFGNCLNVSKLRGTNVVTCLDYEKL